MARSSSNMNSASARELGLADAGRAEEDERADRPVGVLRPERARRSALATGSTASSWPTTRSCSRSSMWISFSVSPSSSGATGIPVQRATTSATSSSSTSSLTIGSTSAPRSVELALELGSSPWRISDALEVALALGALGLHAELVDPRLISLDALERLLLGRPAARRARCGAPSPRRARARRARAPPRTPCPSRRARSRAGARAARPRRARAATSRSPCAGGRRPRRRGRSPCRAAGGRRCSGRRARRQRRAPRRGCGRRGAPRSAP